MSVTERGAWAECIPVLLAEEALRDRRGSLSPEQLYAAIVLTTGDKVKADLERSRRRLDEMRRRGG